MNKLLIAVMVLFACTLGAQVAVPGSASIPELKDKAAAGDAKAQIALAQAYEKGEGVPQNDELAVKWYRAAAEQGDALAQNSVGVMYRLGRGVEKDYQQARQWYEKAANQKLGAALFNLGTVYYNGDGVVISDERAYAYFILAQEAGSKQAADAVQRITGELSPPKLKSARFFLAEFRESLLGEQERALKAYEQLAVEGDRVASIRAAKMYLDGKGVGSDAARARDRCESAAKQKFSPGMVCLGYLHQSGHLGPPDLKTSLEWYKRAAALGNPIAMYSLGVMYAKGTGVKQDNVAAYLWFAQATRGGLKWGQEAMDKVRPTIKKDQALRAEKQAIQAMVYRLTPGDELLEFGRAVKFE